MAKTFHHIGLPTHEPQPNENYVANTKVWVTDPADHPYRVEFLRFEEDSPVTGPLCDMPHIAWRTDDLQVELVGKEIILEPFTPIPGLNVAFVFEHGAVIEFMQFEGGHAVSGDFVRPCVLIRFQPRRRLDFMKRLCSYCLLITAISLSDQAVIDAGNAPGGALNAVADLANEYSEGEAEHWAYRPWKAVLQLPEDRSLRRRMRSPVDGFIFARLEEEQLRPAPPAAPLTLLRRLCFDLTGLPPTAGQITHLADAQPHELDRLVDELLASPRYGERWGQHWLDVVRFAESEGFEYDRAIPGAWRFRDYVIHSFNLDKPFNQFVQEQIAGDEIDPSDPEMLIAVGFHRLGPVRRNAGNPEVSFSRHEVLNERTNILGAAFLGSTLACARCHDHMYDPLRQRDYYALQAYLAGAYEFDMVLASDEEQAVWQTSVDKTKAAIDAVKEELAKVSGPGVIALRKRIDELEAQLPEPLPQIATVREDPEQRTPIHVLGRGDPERAGLPVSPDVFGVLQVNGVAAGPFEKTRPKLALARWITRDDHPLTARVIVNRIWQFHFGRGLVSTANDFGFNGDFPTHPELLDYLADYLVRSGWSIKALHRLILSSATYRQSSSSPLAEVAAEQDRDNQLLWKFHRRRLTAEEIRDAMLFASGQLSTRFGGPSVMLPVEQDLIDLLYKPTQWEVSEDADSHFRRSVYLIAKRNLRLPFLDVFDQPDLQTSCAQRESSTHAPQALELLNGRLSNSLAAAFSERLQRDGSDPVRRAFLLTFGRPPRPEERRTVEQFLGQHELRKFALAMFNTNGFLYVD